MGQTVVELARQDGGIELIGLDRPGAPAQPKLGDLTLFFAPEAAMKLADVYIDFSSSNVTQMVARAAAVRGVAGVIGTTALTEAAEQAVNNLAARAPCLCAPNFSLGVNLLLLLAERAARVLGSSYDLEVVEIHHRDKRDAPSGTALALAEALARGRELAPNQILRGRSGLSGSRPRDQIGVSALRGGAVIGEHTAHFLGPHERIELVHRAESRHAFAAGALRSASWLLGKPPGRYAMADVLDV
jgi:4-hydroxy-tetrahydrodipicolinate reductase